MSQTVAICHRRVPHATAVLAIIALLLVQSSNVFANLAIGIEKDFTPIPNQTDYTVTGLFEFPPLPGDIEGTIRFTKDISIPPPPPSPPPIPLQHVLIGDWENNWSLTKIGFRSGPGGTLEGFGPSFSFGSTGTFEVDFEMLGPVPFGHSSTSVFSVDVPITMIPIDDVFLLPLPATPEVAAILASITSGSGFVPLAVTSLHIPEPSALVLSLFGLIGIGFHRHKRT